MPELIDAGQPQTAEIVVKPVKENNRPWMLSVEEYRKRRSDTLLINPEVSLTEEVEIKKYLRRQNQTYIKKISEFAQLDRPMDPNCRMVITVPSYNEGSRLRHTLEQYAKQNIRPKLFEVVIFTTPVENDSTPHEIEQFRNEHPEISVVFVSKPWEEGEPATVGNGRKYAADIALTRLDQRGPNGEDTILVVNDADTVAIPEDYLKNILDELDRNSLEDAITTSLAIPQEAMAKPNVAMAFSLLNTFEEIYATGNIGENRDKIPEPALTNGRSTAIRVSSYAAIGGYNPNAVISEDWELGWMLADSRDWNPTRIGYFKGTQLITDPRRFIETVINRVPTDQQLIDFKSKPEVRQLDNQKALALVPDSFDWELFQDDVDSIWHSQESGVNMRIGKKRFQLIFNTTLDKLGVKFKIDKSGGIELINVDGLLKNLSRSNQNIEVVHSSPRKCSPELIRKIREYFSGIPIGVIKSRLLKAKRIAEEIKQAQEIGGSDRKNILQDNYERFAGQEYQED